MMADVALFGLSLWAEEDADLDEYFPEALPLSPISSSPPNFRHPTS
jgi:hypothetical protein